jgi:flagellar biosynthesis/type III secretory pathway chaperone
MQHRNLLMRGRNVLMQRRNVLMQHQNSLMRGRNVLMRQLNFLMQHRNSLMQPLNILDCDVTMLLQQRNSGSCRRNMPGLPATHSSRLHQNWGYLVKIFQIGTVIWDLHRAILTIEETIRPCPLHHRFCCQR